MQKIKIVQWVVSPRLILAVVLLVPWLTAPAFAAPGPGTCASDSVSRQLDFWLGCWKMADPGASGASSKVYLSLDKCVFIERWENGKGHVTDKTFAYSPDDQAWYGMFADNEGRAHLFTEGKVTSGKAEFRGQSRGPKGETVLNKLTVTPMPPNKLEETWEKSSDNGANWTTSYKAEYVRANSQ